MNVNNNISYDAMHTFSAN